MGKNSSEASDMFSFEWFESYLMASVTDLTPDYSNLFLKLLLSAVIWVLFKFDFYMWNPKPPIMGLEVWHLPVCGEASLFNSKL